MTHLGTQLSALADGRLDAAARERALCHVAACAACAEELTATRAARRALADAGDVPVSPDLASRLLALGAASGLAGCRLPPDGAGLGTGAGRPAGRTALGAGPVLGVPSLVALVPRVGQTGAHGDRLADLGPRRPSVRAVAAVTVGALTVGLFVLGEERPVIPDSHPAADLALLAAAAVPAGLQGASVVQAGTGTGDDGPAAAVAGTGAVSGGASDGSSDRAPDGVPEGVPDGSTHGLPVGALPPGYAVVATYRDATGTEVDLDGPAGPVVVISERGRLSDAVLREVPATTIGPHEVHVLSVSPWHGVWQSGDEVVGVVAAHRTEAVEAIVGAYPARSFDDGLGAQLSRGWRTVVGAWGP